MNVLRRMVSSQPRAFVPGRYCCQERYAFSMVSCTRSSASVGSAVRRSATRYKVSRWGRASPSNERAATDGSAIQRNVAVLRPSLREPAACSGEDWRGHPLGGGEGGNFPPPPP